MNKSQFLPATYLFNLSLVCILLVFRLNHIATSEAIFLAAMVSQLLYAIPCMFEIGRSTRVPRHEKIAWMLGMLFVTVIAGGLYIFGARKRIANN
jgi:hypothetical protein